MTQPTTADDLRSLWQSMPTTPIVISADAMRAKARAFQSRVRVRNLVDYAAHALVVAAFVSFAIQPWATPLMRIGLALLCLGTLLVALGTHHRARAAAMPAGASATALIDFHRTELTRQRDAMASAWSWYWLPYLPGVAVLIAAFWSLSGDLDGTSIAREILFPTIAGFVIVSAVGVPLHLLGAAHLQRRIDDLDRYKEK